MNHTLLSRDVFTRSFSSTGVNPTASTHPYVMLLDAGLTATLAPPGARVNQTAIMPSAHRRSARAYPRQGVLCRRRTAEGVARRRHAAE